MNFNSEKKMFIHFLLSCLLQKPKIYALYFEVLREILLLLFFKHKLLATILLPVATG